jgi:hypothetical protein
LIRWQAAAQAVASLTVQGVGACLGFNPFFVFYFFRAP